MSARDDVLAAVRAALSHTDRNSPPVPRGYRASAHDDVDLSGLFAERVADYQATVVRCSSAVVEKAITAALDGARTIIPHGLPWAVPDADLDTGQSAAELDSYDTVVTGATVGIALTGTIVLDHQAGQGRRALTLVPDLHVCVVRTDQIVYGVPDALPRLDPRRPQTWVSGPSATSDIELTRVEGVHGPRRLHVLVVEP